jgi:dipeptidyl aminopeptidase/acylaminoacyl peptidase
MMKRTLVTSLAAVVTAAVMHAQGTVEDYRRAYSLGEKFSAQRVWNWAHDVKWSDSAHVVSYSYYTSAGQRWATCNAETGEIRVFETEAAMKEQLGGHEAIPGDRRGGRRGDRDNRQNYKGRQQQRHWMEVDEESDQWAVTSPDGRWEAWVEGYNVVVKPVGSRGEKRQLTQDGTIGNYYSSRILWSPDSRRLFTCKRRAVEKRYVYYVESSPKDQLQPVLHKQEYAKPGDELPQRVPCIFDLETGRQLTADTVLCPNQYSLSWFEWSADGSEVRMEYNQRGHKVYRVLAMNAETGRLRTLVEERSDKFVNYNRTYRKYLADGRLLWMSERDNWNHLYLYDVSQRTKMQKKKGAKTEDCFQLTRGDWCVRRVVHVDEEAGVVYFTASGMNKEEDPYLIHYYKIGLDGKGLVCLTPENGNHKAVFTNDWKYLADTYSRVDMPPVTCLRRTADGSLVQTLAQADISQLSKEGWHAPEVFTAKGRDGETDIWGIIQRPTNFDPQHRYPVIEYIYAGPGDAYTPKDFNPYNWNMTSLAELGFIVVQMDGMGTSWRGKKFEEVCYKNLKDAGFPDRMAWLKAAAEKYPYMDIDRVGIFGASAGGQESTTAVLLHGDFYKAAYSSCGCHDNRMDKIWWNEQWMGYPVDSSYVECSNVYHASKLERPLMLVVGELDDNVDPASTMQVADALIRAGKDFELVVLPGVHHSMGERFGEHKRYDFFVRNLMGVEPPKWGELNY